MQELNLVLAILALVLGLALSVCAMIILSIIRYIIRSVNRLHTSWQRAITVCSKCEKIMFTTDVAKTEVSSDGIERYCKDCAE